MRGLVQPRLPTDHHRAPATSTALRSENDEAGVKDARFQASLLIEIVRSVAHRMSLLSRMAA